MFRQKRWEKLEISENAVLFKGTGSTPAPEIGDSRKTKCFPREKSSRVYRLLPLINTGLIHLRKGAYNWNRKSALKQAIAVLIKIRFSFTLF